MSLLEAGRPYWLGNRTIMIAKVARKHARGLIIEGDGLHTTTVLANAPLKPVTYRGDLYPARKMRGHIRRMTAQTDRAQEYKNLLLEMDK